MSKYERPDPALRLDRTVTIGVLLTLILQTASALFWAGQAESRLSTLEIQADLSRPVTERLARLEEQVLMARQSLIRIERRLDKPEP